MAGGKHPATRRLALAAASAASHWGSFSLVWPVTRLPAIAAIIIVTVEPRGAASDLYASAYLTHGSGHPRSLEPFFFWATGADLSRRSGSLVRTHSRCTGPPNHRMDSGELGKRLDLKRPIREANIAIVRDAGRGGKSIFSVI